MGVSLPKLTNISSYVSGRVTIVFTVKERAVQLMQMCKETLTNDIKCNGSLLKIEIKRIKAWTNDREIVIEKDIKQLKQHKKEIQRLITKADSFTEKMQLGEALKFLRKRTDQDDEIDLQRSEMIKKL